MIKRKRWLFGFLCIGLVFSACQGTRGMADLVLIHGVVWTGEEALRWAEAVAVQGERILAVGKSAEIGDLAGRKTRVIDLKGSLVLPGFIDSHTHFLDGGFSLLSIRLREAESKAEFVARIKEKAEELGPGAWILHGDWDEQQFDPPELPRRDWIDAVTPENPVCVNRHDGHMVLVNSLALRLAGITRDTVSPEGGEILSLIHI